MKKYNYEFTFFYQNDNENLHNFHACFQHGGNESAYTGQLTPPTAFDGSL